MTEITINGRTFRLSAETLSKLNALLKDTDVRKQYGNDWERNNKEIVSVSVVRWSDETRA